MCIRDRLGHKHKDLSTHRATFVKKTCDKVLRSPNPPGGWGGVPQILAKLGNFGFLSETWGNRDSLAKVTKEILNEG